MIALEWRSLAPLNIHPGMSKEAVLAAAGNCGDNIATLLRISLYELIAEAIEDGLEVSGRVTVVQRSQTRAIQLCGIRPMREGWRAPILALDATLDMRLLQRIWPQATPAADIKVALPAHVRVTQTVDAPFSKSWLTGRGRETKRACAVFGAVLGEMILSGDIGPTLVITHKAVEEVLREKAHIPDWVELAHHGNITGMNCWKDCRHLVVIGRPLPPAKEACRITEALFGDYIAHRAYTPTKVLIRIVPDAWGNTAVEVTQLHPAVRLRLLWRWWLLARHSVIRHVHQLLGVGELTGAGPAGAGSVHPRSSPSSSPLARACSSARMSYSITSLR